MSKALPRVTSIPAGFVPAFGVPYARVDEDDPAVVTCPNCGLRIRRTERKDFESFSAADYSEHYMAEHAADDGYVKVGKVVYMPTGA